MLSTYAYALRTFRFGDAHTTTDHRLLVLESFGETIPRTANDERSVTLRSLRTW